MPLSELLPAAARQKRGPFQQTMSAAAAANCSSDLSPLVPDQDFVELLWENGQIVMQGQSHRASKSSSPPSLPSFSGRPGGVPADFSGKELAAGGYLGHPGFANQDAEMPPWPNYRIEDYSLDFLAEFTSSSPSSLPATVPGAQFSTPPPTEALQLSPKSRSREPVFSSVVDLLPGRTQKHDEHAGPGAANFSHFLRPAAAPAKAAAPPDHSLPSFDIRASENASAAASSNPPESTLIDPVSCSRSLSSFHGDSAPGGMAWADDNQEDSSRFPSRIDTANPPRPSAETSGLKSSSLAGAAAGEKLHEPVATSPSMCSASCKRKLKNQDGDDSECHSEDVEDESAEAKKPSPSAKRSRAAEVHNLSERKRRDRINEKLRALQELIPNCSKVDKASVLDEAIEYLKSLQMQLRIMSTGGGMYMPPMIVPPGMQASPMGPFSSMGLGMGFGMGVIDSNGYPFVPPPPLPYPCAAIPPPGTQRGMLGHTTFRTYGAPPMPVPIPRSHAAFIPMAAPPMKVNGPAEMTTEASHAGGTE